MMSNHTTTWQIWIHRVFCGLTLLVIASTLLRMFLGVDFTDEAFYVALPYRFALGDIPFRDEIAMQQTAAFLLYWPVKLYLLLMKTTDGIVLYGRMIFFGLTCLVSFFVYKVLKPRIGILGLWGALALFTVPVLPIPNFSYNTGGQLFYSAALVSALYGICSGRDGAWFWFGLLASLAVVSYPSLMLVVLPLSLVFFVGLVKDSKKLSLIFLAGGVLILAIPIISGLSLVGWDRIEWAYHFAMATKPKGGGIEKVLHVVRQAYTYAPLLLVLFYPISVAVLRFKKEAQSELRILFSLMITGWLFYSPFLEPVGWVNPKITIYGLALIGPSAFLMGRRNKVDRDVFCCLWFPSILAGFVTAYTSGLGLLSFYVGGTLAAISTLILVGRFAFVSVVDGKESSVRSIAIFPFGTFVILMCFLNYRYVYRDSQVTKLSKLIRTGPFAGLLTNRRKEMAIEALSPILSRFRSDQKVIFYDDFPAGYLFSSTGVGHCSIWSVTGNKHRKMYLPCIRQLSGRGFQAVKIKFNPNRPFLGSFKSYRDPFEKALAKLPKESVIENSHYVLSRFRFSEPISVTAN